MGEMFQCKVQAKILKNIMESLKDLVNEVNIEIKTEGL